MSNLNELQNDAPRRVRVNWPLVAYFVAFVVFCLALVFDWPGPAVVSLLGLFGSLLWAWIAGWEGWRR